MFTGTRWTWDIKLYIRGCPVCCKNKPPSKVPRASLSDFRVGFPLDRLAMDVMGPLPVSKNNNKYILVIGDYFTRWMEAYPLPNQQAENVARCLVFEFFNRWGIPLELHSDQGRNFESDLIKHLCKLLDITKTRTTPIILPPME